MDSLKKWYELQENRKPQENAVKRKKPQKAEIKKIIITIKIV